MEYHINKNNYKDFDIYDLGKCAPRSYLIPYPDRSSAAAVSLRDKRYNSPKVLDLGGEWDFKFYNDPKTLPDFLDTGSVDWDRIPVPACWQFHGYDRPFYLNTRYQFPYNPPEIPGEDPVGTVFSWGGADLGIKPRWQKPDEEYNFVGVYRRFFDIESTDMTYTISFLGVASCLDLYVNGEFVGYSEGSHNIAEFDISDHVRTGDNELLAVVHRWCNGTYLEAQDMFRNNGIFRDVLLYCDEKEDIWDVYFETKKKDGKYDALIHVSTISDTEVTVSLTGEDIKETGSGVTTDRSVEISLSDLEVTEWNAEEPVLYDLFVETPTSCVKLRVGFKDVTIRDGKFYLNDSLVKFKGVNHHDTSPTEGYTMSRDEIERDMRLCKKYNIDTVRTSHYPPDPYLLELCDEMGIYVVDENDLETHGTFHMNLPPSYNYITDDSKWAPRYIDRISHLFERDKNHACIVMWSLGNEAGGDYCIDREYDYLKAHTSIPVHYESCIHSKRIAYDVGSQMYPDVERVRLVGEKRCEVEKLNDRPYFLCEYAHAMGVGPGNIEDYWQQIYAHDNLMGGCVWEMVDHGVLERDGNYTYGGDHGEWIHDSNFCVDGIFYPDRTPSTGADIVRFTYRPIRVRHLDGDDFEVFNTCAFSESDRYRLDFTWSDGRSTSIVPDVHPLSKKRVAVIPEKKGGKVLDGDLLVRVQTYDTRDGDRLVGDEQILLESRKPEVKVGKKAPIFPKGFTIRAGEPSTILFRAGTDNDVDILMRDVMEPWYHQVEKLINYKEKDNKILMRSEIKNKKGIFLCTDYYEAMEGGIRATSELRTMRGGGDIPRFGKTFHFSEDFDIIEYQGRSGESYCDMKDQYPIDVVKCSVSDMTTPNIRPQESGNRSDTSWVTISDGHRRISFISLDGTFELGIKPYTDAALIKMGHRSDEKRTGTYVTLSAFQRGIGTGSCGPQTHPRFTYPADRTYRFSYLIRIED